MKVVGIIQARMGSTRLPGKILMDIGGQPMLARVVERSARCRLLDRVVVATSTLAKDDAVWDLCRARGWNCFRGSEMDVLDRYYQAAVESRADVVVRLTADCPLLDPGFIGGLVQAFLDRKGELDYLCSFLPRRTYPRGLDAEVFSFAALERAWREDGNELWREHVTMYMLKHPESFRIDGLPGQEDHASLRWTVDVPQDMELVRRVYASFATDDFGWREVVALFQADPSLAEINRNVEQFTIQ